MTRLLDYLFNNWAFTTLKNCPKVYKICKSKLKIFPNTKSTLSKWPKFLNLLPKWLNFAKSGHTVWHPKNGQKKQPQHPVLFLFARDYFFSFYLFIFQRCSAAAAATRTTKKLNAFTKMLFWCGSSVTRFGKISPLWQLFTSLWHIFDSLFLIWQNAYRAFANLWYFWANFHCCKWPNI